MGCGNQVEKGMSVPNVVDSKGNGLRCIESLAGFMKPLGCDGHVCLTRLPGDSREAVLGALNKGLEFFGRNIDVFVGDERDHFEYLKK